MERLTTNKDVSEMSMYELAHNSCYAKDGRARYRDYDTDIDAREVAKKLLSKYADMQEEFTDDEEFDEYMENYLSYGIDHLSNKKSIKVLIASFYANLWAMADLRERLAEYEDLEEQGKLLIVPKIKKNKILYWIWADEIMPVLFRRIVGCAVDSGGNPHVMCEMELKKDRTFVHTYRRKPVEHTFKAGEKRYFYSEDIGQTVFLTKEAAKSALKEMSE